VSDQLIENATRVVALEQSAKRGENNPPAPGAALRGFFSGFFTVVASDTGSCQEVVTARYHVVASGGMTYRTFTIRLGAEEAEALDAIRERDGVPVSEQVRRGVALWLAQQGGGAPPGVEPPKAKASNPNNRYAEASRARVTMGANAHTPVDPVADERMTEAERAMAEPLPVDGGEAPWEAVDAPRVYPKATAALREALRRK
jgi:hypothetical protein